MSDPQNSPGMAPPPPAAPPPPPAAPPPAPAASARPAMPSIFASMSQGELFIAGGAALVLLTDLIFVIFGPYTFSNVIWAAAAVALVVVLGRGQMAASMGGSETRYPTLLSLLALTAFVVVIRELVEDLIVLSRALGGLSVSFLLGMVGLYVGVALMAFGAWQLWKRGVA
jgi:hypothetical protein